MFAEVAAAAMVGVSFSNSWVCLLLSLGTSTHSKKMAGAFIIGRFLGIMTLGVLVALFGLFIDIPTKYYTLVFGIITILFGLYIFARHILPKTPLVRKIPVLRKLSVLGCTDCSHKLGTAGKGGETTGSAGCDSEETDSAGCNSKDTSCSSSCDHCTSHSGKSTDITSKGGFLYGMLRGATPCLKMLILAPLLITVSLPLAVLLTAVFALSSSIYPLIGFLAGGIITQFAGLTRSKKAVVVLNLISLVLLLGIGIYYVYKFFTSTCSLEGV